MHTTFVFYLLWVLLCAGFVTILWIAAKAHLAKEKINPPDLILPLWAATWAAEQLLVIKPF